VLWAGSPKRFQEAILGLERLHPGFCARYDIHTYADLAFLPPAALRQFNELMYNIGRCTKLLDRAGIPAMDDSGRELDFWERLGLIS
jgi:hypothetical protein